MPISTTGVLELAWVTSGFRANYFGGMELITAIKNIFVEENWQTREGLNVSLVLTDSAL